MKNLEGEGARPQEMVVFFPSLPSFQQDTTSLMTLTLPPQGTLMPITAPLQNPALLL